MKKKRYTYVDYFGTENENNLHFFEIFLPAILLDALLVFKLVPKSALASALQQIRQLPDSLRTQMVCFWSDKCRLGLPSKLKVRT